MFSRVKETWHMIQILRGKRVSDSSPVDGYADSIIELLQIMEKNGDEPQWISSGETVFERLWFIVEQNEGRERLEKLFPHYA